MIQLDRLSKSFGTHWALDALSLTIPAGEIFGLLGHNGAGKSTTLGLTLGLLRPNGGEAFIRGHSVQRERRRALQGVGVVFEAPTFYDYLSGWNNLRIFTGYSARLGDAEIMETVRFVGLEERIRDLVRVYSHGMRQRLALAHALLPRPDLLLLDEPAEGLDPEGIREMRHLILRLNRERGMTVLLSSHLLSEVEQMCNRIAILSKGELIFEGRLSDMRGDKSHFHLEVDDWEKATPLILAFGATIVSRETIALPPNLDTADLVTALVKAGIRLRALEPARQSLEETYLKMVGAG